MPKEYAIWGTRNGVEDIVRVNGEEVQTNPNVAKQIVKVLAHRGEFQNLRIQTLNLTPDYNPANEFKKAIRFK